MAQQDINFTPNDELELKSQAMKALGLKHQPFNSPILSDSNIYTDSILNKHYETIKHHLQFSDLILIVEGELGSGKTILYRRLLQVEIASLFIMPIQAEATDTLVQIHQKMALHMQDQGDANYLDDNLKNLQVFDQTPVLIIDDAHVLSDTTLQELLRYKQQLAAEKDTQLKFLLLANAGMARTLEQISDLEHNQLYVLEMPKFSSKQILAFIAHRLKLAGAQSLPQLDDASIKKLSKKTQGIPSEVISAAVKLINEVSGKKAFSLKLPSRTKLLVLSLVSLLALAGWYLYPVFSPKMADLADIVFTDTTPSDEPAPLPLPSTVPERTVQHTQKDKPAAPSPKKPAAFKPLPSPVPEKIVQHTQKDKPLPTHRQTPVEQAKPEVKAKAPTQDVEIESITKAPPISPPPVKKPIQPIDPALKTLAKMGIKDQNWLLQQNKRNWTLQVLGAREPQTLVKFAQTHRLGRDSAWFKTSLNGAPWYVLVHRFYADRDIARNSISRLPHALRQARPWVRSLKSIHLAAR